MTDKPILVHASGNQIKAGDTVTDFRGDKHVVTALWPFAGMFGKVQLDNFGSNYPSVIDCEFQVRGALHRNR